MNLRQRLAAWLDPGNPGANHRELQRQFDEVVALNEECFEKRVQESEKYIDLARRALRGELTGAERHALEDQV